MAGQAGAVQIGAPGKGMAASLFAFETSAAKSSNRRDLFSLKKFRAIASPERAVVFMKPRERYFCMDKKHVSDEHVQCKYKDSKYDCALHRDVIVVNQGYRKEKIPIGTFSVIDTDGLIVKSGIRKNTTTIEAKDNFTRCVVSDKKKALVCVWPLPMREEAKYPCLDIQETLAPARIIKEKMGY